jgi:murein DD-endopeptidase MepM/ murein hydrolase activator NlpD
MRKSLYRYNHDTCQYERVRITAGGVVWYVLGVVTIGAFFLVGLLFLHDFIVETENEQRLTRENRALRRHHSILTAELTTLQPVLTSLQQKDQSLHRKFFGTLPRRQTADTTRASKQALLLADSQTFREQVSLLGAHSDRLLNRSGMSSHFFATSLSLKKDDLERLARTPTLQPVHPWNADHLISGFGMRINPFHKGLYMHAGVDIAAPRGTPVVATASGRISQLKRSDLQAGYGNYLEIDHGNGLITRYAHLEDIAVRYGARVEKGDTIASVGSTGGSIAPHLHYEVLRDGDNVDPVYYMVEGLTADEHYELTTKSHQQNQSLD